MVTTLNNRVDALLRLPLIPKKQEHLPVDGYLYETERSFLRLLTRPIKRAGARMWYTQDYHESKLGPLVGAYMPGDPLEYMLPEELEELTEYVRELEKRVSARINGTNKTTQPNKQSSLPYADSN